MPLISSFYKAPLWIGGKHAQTIIPVVFRKVNGVNYRRERIETHDQDFVDLDWSQKGHTRLAIVSHGLEANSYQPYILGMVKFLNAHGWDALAWNFRSCSGELNRTIRLYHAGSVDDLRTVIKHVESLHLYKEIAFVAFSLGGNILLKYLGDHCDEVPNSVTKAVAFSVPCDLYACAQELSVGLNRMYLNRFLTTLKDKMAQKAKLYPGLFSGIDLDRIQTLVDFDRLITAPLCGFQDVMHYYLEASCKKSLPKVHVPTLIVNALNDPFLHPACFPIEACQTNKALFFEAPYDGGHQGFIKKQINGVYWSEERAIQFLSN